MSFDEQTLRHLHNPEMKYVAAFGICRGLLEALSQEDDIPVQTRRYIQSRLDALKREMA